MTDEEAVIVEWLRRHANSPKLIASVPEWVLKDHKSTERAVLKAALEIEGVIVEGLFFNGRASRSPPDCDVSFTVSMTYAGVNHNLARIDWKPRRPHTARRGNVLVHHKAFQSQIHGFEANARRGLDFLRAETNLPEVALLHPEPSTFHDLLTAIRAHFKIEDSHRVPTPPWDTQGKLL